MRNRKRHLTTKKLLLAAVGVGAVSYVVACDGSTAGNLMARPSDYVDASRDAVDDRFASSGNLMAPGDTGADVHADAPADAGADGTDAAIDDADASVDASDDGG